MDGGDLPTFYPTRVIFLYNRYGVGGRLRRPFRGRAFLRASAIASWRSYDCNAVSRHCFLGALFAECVRSVGLSGHRSPAAPCTAVIRRHCLSGTIGYVSGVMVALPFHGIYIALPGAFCILHS